MNKNHRSHLHKHYKHYLLGIFILVVLIFGGGWWLAEHYKPILSQKLKKKVYIASDSLYHLHFSEIQLHPILGNLTIDSLHLIPDTTVFNRLKEKHRAPNHLFDVFIRKLKIKHVHYIAFLLNKKLKVKKISAHDIQLDIHHPSDLKHKKDTGKASIKQRLVQFTSSFIKSIQISEIGLHHIAFNYENRNAKRAGEASLEDLNLTLTNIKIDTASAKDPERLLFAKDIRLHLKQALYFSSDSLYKVTTGAIDFSFLKKKGMVTDLKLKPRYKEQEFEQQFKYRHDRFDVSMDSIQFSQFSLDNQENKRWHFGKLKIKDAFIDIYLDAALLVKKVAKPLPQDMLRQVGTNLLIDTVALKNTNIKYRERNPDSKKVGYVTFNHINGNITNITNDTTQIHKEKYCKADLNALFMDSGKLHATFRFNLADSNNTFTYKGHLGFLKAEKINPATMPLGMIKIKSGRIHSLDYAMKANKESATGSVGLKYDHLKVKILSKNNQTGDLEKLGWLSFAANLLVLKKDNMEGEVPIQTTGVHYKRDKYRSVFNLMWKSIFSGVKPLVGVDKKTQKGIKSLQSIKKEVKGGK